MCILIRYPSLPFNKVSVINQNFLSMLSLLLFIIESHIYDIYCLVLPILKCGQLLHLSNESRNISNITFSVIQNLHDLSNLHHCFLYVFSFPKFLARCFIFCLFLTKFTQCILPFNIYIASETLCGTTEAVSPGLIRFPFVICGETPSSSSLERSLLLLLCSWPFCYTLFLVQHKNNFLLLPPSQLPTLHFVLAALFLRQPVILLLQTPVLPAQLFLPLLLVQLCLLHFVIL